MYRYLINLSYIGTPFRGLQKQISRKDINNYDPTTIQGQVDLALKRLHCLEDPTTIFSSRTDAGVHALHSTLHVNLQRVNGKPYEPVYITKILNSYFRQHEVPIRILKSYLVPNTFHCRFNAISRTYLYRLIVCNNQQVLNESMLEKYLPVQENDRSLIISTNTFDVVRLKEAADLFLGLHDFRTFMHKSTLQPDKMTRRIIKEIEVTKGEPFWNDRFWPTCISDKPCDYTTYHIIIKGNGFLHKQVRRTVASLVAVAKGIVTAKDIKFMLEIPSHRSWDTRIKTVPAGGLFLCEVAYSKSDWDTFKEHL